MLKVSVLVEFGNTKVLCNAAVEENVPRALVKGQGKGWVTAEYLACCHVQRTLVTKCVEAASGKQGGRTMEINA